VIRAGRKQGEKKEINRNDNTMPMGEPTMPSAEELREAEESMTTEQGIESNVREKFHQKRQEIGIQIPEDLKYELKASDRYGLESGDFISGTFNGHFVDLKVIDALLKSVYVIDSSELVRGTVDGKPLTKSETRALWLKLYDVIKTISSEMSDAEYKKSQEYDKRRGNKEEFEKSREGIETALEDLGI